MKYFIAPEEKVGEKNLPTLFSKAFCEQKRGEK
eukprot:UN08913